MKAEIDILRKNRKTILDLVDEFSIDQLNNIPKGFSNNLIWNMAHMVVTQQLLCYKFSELPMLIENSMAEKFRKGTKPLAFIQEEEIQIIKKLFLDLPGKLELDLKNGLFKKYQAYTTSLNVELTDIDSALVFNNFHEGIHLGVILSLRKLI